MSEDSQSKEKFQIFLERGCPRLQLASSSLASYKKRCGQNVASDQLILMSRSAVELVVPSFALHKRLLTCLTEEIFPALNSSLGRLLLKYLTQARCTCLKPRKHGGNNTLGCKGRDSSWSHSNKCGTTKVFPKTVGPEGDGAASQWDSSTTWPDCH